MQTDRLSPYIYRTDLFSLHNFGRIAHFSLKIVIYFLEHGVPLTFLSYHNVLPDGLLPFEQS